jgi:DNA-binding NarL/FixJ family response regulator
MPPPSPDDAIRVLVAEDHAGMRALVRLLLDDEDDMIVVGEVSDGDEVVPAASDLAPDAVVLDLALPHIDGEDSLQELRAHSDDMTIVVLSGEVSALNASRLEELGADAVLEKGTRNWEDRLLAALRENQAPAL